MKRFFAILFINLLLVLLQLSFFGELFGVGFLPNLVLALAISLVLNDSNDMALLSGFLGGLLLDLLGFNIVGVSSLSITVLSGILILIRRSVSKSWIVNIAYVIFAALIYDRAAGNSESFFSSSALSASFVTLGVSVILYFAMRGILDYLKRSGYKVD